MQRTDETSGPAGEMKRVAGLIILIGVALGSIVLAQPSQATLRTTAGDHPVAVLEQSGQVFLLAEGVTEALGGTIAGDRSGYRIIINGKTAGFTAASRFGAVGEELVEMPTAPVFVDNRPFVPWEFFRDVVRLTSGQDLRWDPQTRIFEVAPLRLDTIDIEIGVVRLAETTKIIIEFPRQIPYAVRRDAASFTIETRYPLRANITSQSYEGDLLDRIAVGEREIVIHLASTDVAGDPYSLENPFRIVLDLQRGQTPASPATPADVARPREPLGVRTIVLDPGHGGKEVGASGPAGLVEKETTLAICRRLQPLLAAALGARVILTRDGDELVSLDQRTALANQYKADLFLSVHLNASRSATARGAETYFLSLEASDELAHDTAERENAEGQGAAAQGVQPASDLNLILWDLAQQEYLKESSRFAELIQQEMNGAAGTANRGVKQAPFRVLIGATMPAALVEVGFISNGDEESKLASAAYQEAVAQALVRAISRFKDEYETRLGLRKPAAPPAQPAPPQPSAQQSRR
ncbi:MAG TPA: N-acetylmuramoyl-L-alanine amidase [Thermoanaerobaculia bacterium]|nr:N-acetylmuramoyl-L-alanine amidase [Thermoanaerobaculia bacterium]